MGSHKRKVKTAAVEAADPSEAEGLEYLAEAVMENMEESLKVESDPFDSYAAHITAQLFNRKIGNFPHRFASGYLILLQTINLHEPKSKN